MSDNVKPLRAPVQVAFDERATQVLDTLRDSTGRSIADVIRDALGLYDFLREEVEAGRSFAIVDHAGNCVREFILPFRVTGQGKGVR